MSAAIKHSVGRSRGWAGFTLHEMLVVVAIISVLAAITLPVLAKARKSGQRTRCLSNMRQLAVAYFAHAQDRGQTIRYESRGDNSGWVETLKKESGLSDEILHCPLCYRNNQHSLGDARKAWRFGNAGGGLAARKPGAMVADASPSSATFAAAATRPAGDDGKIRDEDWARNPQYYAFVAGVIGATETAEFKLKFGGEKSQCALAKEKEGGSIVLLVMCENLFPTKFSLSIWDAETGRGLHTTDGITIGKTKPKETLAPKEVDKGDGTWELFDWAGPLSRSLGGTGSLLGPDKPFHQTPVGFDQATFSDRQPLTQGHLYPDAPNGRGGRNIIYKRPTIHSEKSRTLNVAVRGDDSCSVFVLSGRGGCCSGGPGTLCESAKPATSTYAINAWAQSNHPMANHEGHRFYERVEQGHSEVPVFAEGIWADLMPRSSDPAPQSLHGSNGGLSRVCIDRHDHTINVAFMDGSVRNTKLPELWAMPWHKDWERPTTAPTLPKY